MALFGSSLERENARRKRQMLKGVVRVLAEHYRINNPERYQRLRRLFRSPVRIRTQPGVIERGKRTVTHGRTTKEYAPGMPIPRFVDIALSEDEIFVKGKDGRLYLRTADGRALVDIKEIRQGNLPVAVSLGSHELAHALEPSQIRTQRDRIQSEIAADASAVIDAMEMGAKPEVVKEALAGRVTRPAVVKYVKAYLNMVPKAREAARAAQIRRAAIAIRARRVKEAEAVLRGSVGPRRLSEMREFEKVREANVIARRLLAAQRAPLKGPVAKEAAIREREAARKVARARLAAGRARVQARERAMLKRKAEATHRH